MELPDASCSAAEVLTVVSRRSRRISELTATTSPISMPTRTLSSGTGLTGALGTSAASTMVTLTVGLLVGVGRSICSIIRANRVPSAFASAAARAGSLSVTIARRMTVPGTISAVILSRRRSTSSGLVTWLSVRRLVSRLAYDCAPCARLLTWYAGENAPFLSWLENSMVIVAAYLGGVFAVTTSATPTDKISDRTRSSQFFRASRRK
ncbi:hypothetical protein HD595_005297 [Nonomuraea roseoviolacea subsp. carminata]|uniref:Uncharacterized protein n=1 Tax=Nonomuraea roseoviolacea subsp. carminata TaxID=160689 RepID=A0ABT1K5A2_9ACTN|nr:hypothetical protein [Nonomuraea roseoviolacea]MCP2349175.1 hypothetical protein [Nonomuraea roseoviolacea subsp. carminata]